MAATMEIIGYHIYEIQIHIRVSHEDYLFVLRLLQERKALAEYLWGSFMGSDRFPLKKKKKKVLGETDFSETEAHAEHRREHCASIRRMTLKF